MFEIDPGIIDGKVLFEKVKATAKAKNIAKEFYNDQGYDTTEVSLSKMHETMINIYQNLQIMSAVSVYEEKPLNSIHPVVGKGIVFFKRIFRKMTRWMIQPIYMQQSEFNAAVSKTMSEMIQLQEMLIQTYEKSLKKEDEDED